MCTNPGYQRDEYCLIWTEFVSEMEKSAVDLTEGDIDNITDLFAAFKILQKLQVSPKGLTNLEDAKCRLLQYIRERYGAGKRHQANVRIRSSLYRHYRDFLAFQLNPSVNHRVRRPNTRLPAVQVYVCIYTLFIC